MNRSTLRYILLFLAVILFFRFIRLLLLFSLRFWYISIPLYLLLYFHFRKRIRAGRRNKLDPDKEVPIDVDFTVENDEEIED